MRVGGGDEESSGFRRLGFEKKKDIFTITTVVKVSRSIGSGKRVCDSRTRLCANVRTNIDYAATAGWFPGWFLGSCAYYRRETSEREAKKEVHVVGEERLKR